MWPPDTSSTASGGSSVGLLEPRRVEVRLEVVDADVGQVGDERERLRRAHADEQRAGEAGAVARGDRVEVGAARRPPRRARRRSPRSIELDVRAARDLGDHTAEPRVQVDLARHDRRAGRRGRPRRPRPRSRRTTSRSRGSCIRRHAASPP